VRARVDGHDSLPLERWFVSGAGIGPLPARVPGTAAGALRDAGLWDEADERDFDADEWTFTSRFSAAPVETAEEVVLRLDGIATVADVELNGRPLVSASSMFAAHEIDVGRVLAAENELVVRCAPLLPLLAAKRRPRARWRTRVVAEQNLRFFRTTMLGRAPGFAPRPAPVGPWRPVTLERRRRVVVDSLELRTALDGDAAVLSVRARLRSLDATPAHSLEVELRRGATAAAATLPVNESGVAVGEVRLRHVERWWPHTHGEPALYDVRLRVDDVVVDAGRVGFRTLESPADAVALRINDCPVFARGAVWTPVDPVGFAPTAAELRAAVAAACDGGMNMLRIPGTSCYEADAFHDACDELGVLVWQDLMFANFDYPFADDAFAALAEAEVRCVLARLAPRPSTAVLCGNSEVEQQATMLGLDPAVARVPFFHERVPELLDETAVDVPYVTSTPSGGDLPFRPSRGVANYYGVGAYRRPLGDARRAQVRFAAECLAFANVPDGGTEAELPVPRDVGADWDFADVRDHYLRELFAVDPAALRASDADRYLELSRVVSGEVMAATIGEWRRSASPCHGALVLMLRDVRPGAGWGVLDDRGAPKVAWWYLRRAFAPVAIWLTDEGLDGVDVHIANDRPQPLAAQLRVALYRDRELLVEEVTAEIRLPPHAALSRGVEELLGRFVDASYAYRFGAPGHDLVAATLEGDDGLLTQAFAFPVDRPVHPEQTERLGLDAVAGPSSPGTVEVVITSVRFAYCVRVHAEGYRPLDDAFSIEPGGRRAITLVGRPGAQWRGGTATALNLAGSVVIA
jgi:beta-mannosidase